MLTHKDSTVGAFFTPSRIRPRAHYRSIGRALLAAGIGVFGFGLLGNSSAQAQNVVALDQTSYQVNESEGTADIIVRVNRANNQTVTVDYRTNNGSANAGSDYRSTSGTLTFAANETAKLVRVPIIDDLAAENQEQFTFTIFNPNNAVVDSGRDRATVRINDNDANRATIGFTSAKYRVNETAGQVTITVTRQGGEQQRMRVDYYTSPVTAVPGEDYQSRSGTLVFEPGETRAQFKVPIIDDAKADGDLTFSVNLKVPEGASPQYDFGIATATVTIDDNEISTVTFSADTYSASENGGSATITLLRTGNTNSAGRVSVVTVAGTATADQDYATTSRNVDFAQGQTFATFEVPIFDDREVEGTESFQVSLTSSPNSGVVIPGGGNATAEVQIFDDESANTVEFTGRVFSVEESDGPAVVTVRLNRATGSNETVSVQYFTETGSATPRQDYTATSASSNSRLTFGPGETIKTFKIPIANDTVREGTETVGLVLANPANASLGTTSAATLNIIDDDSAGAVQFSSETYSVYENAGAVTLTVLLNRTGTGNDPVTVDFAVVAGSADARRFGQPSPPSQLRFNSGSSIATITIPINADNAVQPPQTFTVVLSNPTNATLGNPSSATVTIQDDDGLNSVQFDAAEYGAVESDGSVVLRVTATRGGDPNQVLTVRIALGAPGDTAERPADYQNPSNTTITFPPGTNSQRVVIPITNNLAAQPPRIFTATLLSPGPFTTIGRQGQARVTILDNSGPNTVQFLTSSQRFREGSQSVVAVTMVRYGDFNREGTNATFTTELRRGDTAIPDLNFTPTSDSVEFAPILGTIGSPPRVVVVGNETRKTILIPMPDNDQVQGEVTFHVTLTGSDVAEFGDIVTTKIIVEDDDVGNVVQFSNSNYSVVEGGGGAEVTVTLTPSGDTSTATTVDYAATGISAFPSADFSPVSGTLVFAPGETVKKFFVPIVNDNISEPTETFRVTLTKPSPGTLLGSLSTSVVSIIDNDLTSSIQFSPASYTVNETSGTVTLRVVANRAGEPSASLSVRYRTIGGTAAEQSDFAPSSGTIVFAGGETQKNIVVGIINDTLIEGPENFSVVLEEPGNGASVGQASTATVTIADDDSPAASIGFSSATYTVDEGAGFANLVVMRSGGLGVSTSVDYQTSDGTATAEVNYRATSGRLTFAVGEVSKTIQVPIIDDSTNNPTLSFTVTLTSPDGDGQVGGQSTATVFIVDNDATTFRFNPASYSVEEGAASVTLTVEALRVGDPAQTITVDYVTSDGSAKAGQNYERTSGRLTFASGETRKTITVPIIDNNVVDGTTSFRVSLANPRAEGEGDAPPKLGEPSVATVTITDNDATTFQFSSPSYTVENSSGSAVLTVNLSRVSNPNGTFSVDYSTANMSAVAGRDYSAQSGRLTFSAGETSKTISIPLTPQPVGQPARQFRVTLSNPSPGAQLGAISSTVVTILNRDLSTKLMNVSTRGVVEQGEGVMIAGFIVQGSNQKQVVVRGLGPSLTALGVPSAIADPTVQLLDANGTQLAYDDDYASIPAPDQQVLSANGLTPTEAREAAIVATVAPGNYTAILRGKTNGIGLVEVYDLSATTATRLVNISTRAKVAEGDNGALIAGFIIASPENSPGTAQRVVIRAIGPSLTNGGVSDALADPTLEIYRGSVKILENDNWKTQTAEGVNSQSDIEATGLQPSSDKEAVIMTALDPGSYTAVIRGKDNTTGIGLAEVYQLSQ